MKVLKQARRAMVQIPDSQPLRKFAGSGGVAGRSRERRPRIPAMTALKHQCPDPVFI